MERRCFINECMYNVSSFCSCSNTKIYSCSVHKNYHLLEKNHMMKPLFISIEPSTSSRFEELAIKALGHLDNLEKDTLGYARNLINIIIEESKKTLYNIKNYSLLLWEFHRAVRSENVIDSDLLEMLKYGYDPIEYKHFVEYPRFCSKLKKMFKLDLFAPASHDCNQIIFSKDYINGGLWSLSLNDLSKRKLEYFPLVFPWGSACRVKKDTYFFYGGFKKDTVTGDAIILRPGKKRFEVLPPGTPNHTSGTACKNGKVYIFGGFSARPLNTFQIFHISSRKFESSISMPSVMSSCTAALLGKEIIVCGFESEKVYSYDFVEFSPILNVPGCKYKVVCPGWIVTPSTLYENTGNGATSWKAYNSVWTEHNLFVFTTFSKGFYIYFLCGNDTLWRVDTRQKKIEAVNILSPL